MRTNRSEDKLIERKPLHDVDRGHSLRERESVVQEPKPPKLDRCHQEAIAHEARQSFEIESGR